MRPIERGAAPRIYSKYEQAISDLEERLGSYCSYCERKFTTNLAVEHVVPKSMQPELEVEWTNFLLGCTNCNSIKGKKTVEINKFLWCDRDNTFIAFTYSSGGFIQLSDGLEEGYKTKAKALLDLVGLQRHQASGWDNPRPRDKRWKDRELTWILAEKCRDNFEIIAQKNIAKDLVLIAAQCSGFFSVWMTVFDAYPDIKRELINLFPGTAISCFNADGKPIARPNSIVEEI
jgi:uncharacterized protein (TIGR02646 family)